MLDLFLEETNSASLHSCVRRRVAISKRAPLEVCGTYTFVRAMILDPVNNPGGPGEQLGDNVVSQNCVGAKLTKVFAVQRGPCCTRHAARLPVEVLSLFWRLDAAVVLRAPNELTDLVESALNLWCFAHPRPGRVL